jgi:hypothetical protein
VKRKKGRSTTTTIFNFKDLYEEVRNKIPIS